jgi:hypothetical protein
MLVAMLKYKKISGLKKANQKTRIFIALQAKELLL